MQQSTQLVLGTLAGETTVLVVAREGVAGARVRDELRGLTLAASGMTLWSARTGGTTVDPAVAAFLRADDTELLRVRLRRHRACTQRA